MVLKWCLSDGQLSEPCGLARACRGHLESGQILLRHITVENDFEDDRKRSNGEDAAEREAHSNGEMATVRPHKAQQSG